MSGLFSSFFTTIFTYNVINSFSLRVWDLFFVFHDKVILETLIKILRLIENDLLKLGHDVS